MRIALPFGRAALFVAALALALVALFPLRLALGGLGQAGVSARAAAGSIWSGRLVEARIAGAPVGDLDAALRPLPLLLGRARVDLARDGEGAPFAGTLGIGRHYRALDEVTARLPLGDRLAPLPLSAVDLSGASAAFRDGLCDRASGLVKLELAGDLGGVALPGGLSGAARCEGGALLLPLASQSGMERLTLAVRGDGGWRADLLVRPTGEAARAGLAAAGFRPGADGYAMHLEGRP